jgi:hypothetical protein
MHGCKKGTMCPNLNARWRTIRLSVHQTSLSPFCQPPAPRVCACACLSSHAHCSLMLQEGKPEEVASVKEAAATAAADFIRSPDVFQFDLLESPVMAQLKGDRAHGAAFELLVIMLSGDIQVGVLPGTSRHLSVFPFFRPSQPCS